MGRIVVDVMPKSVILDPQGKAITAALPREGLERVRHVRQGKRFEIDVDGEVDDALLARVAELASSLLANPSLEDVTRVAAVEDDEL
ncbi:MAG TPA: phosphoribosylformylglycinamidine synthase subunit PurS [Actinomycetaceae bacterium]|nr:phosphoribosylformylglycinamidine synthase subunit PurS [Actinomycetaceae bacterium]